MPHKSFRCAKHTCLLVFAVTDLIAYLQVKEIANEVKNQINDADAADGSVEVEYREVDD